MPALQPIDDLSAAVRDELNAPWGGCQDAVTANGGPREMVRRSFTVQQAVQSPAQARARMAYFLSQVCVASDRHPDLNGKTRLPEMYWDVLMKRALGPYKDLLLDVTFSSTQLFYLTLLDSRKADGDGIAPDENYAREVMQLFTTGKDELDADGMPNGEDVYTREDVSEAARVLTGLVNAKYVDAEGRMVANHNGRTADRLTHLRVWPNGSKFYESRLHPRSAWDAGPGVEDTYVNHEHHDYGEVMVLGRTIPSDQAAYDQLAAIDASAFASGHQAPYDANNKGNDTNVVAMMDLARGRVEKLVDILVEHPNTVRNLARQMIGHHVTRSYSPAYFRRVVQAGQDGTYILPDGSVIGTGEPLDLAAMYAAVRLDPEARASADGKDRLWGRHRPAFLAYCSAIRPLLAAGEVAPVSDVKATRALSGPGTVFEWDVKNRTTPVTAPSVFSFFEGTFAVPKEEFLDAGVLTSELQIVDTQSVMNFAAQLGEVATCMTPTALSNLPTKSNASDKMEAWSLDLARFLQIADDPQALTAMLDLEFTGDALEEGSADLVRQVIEGVSASSGGITDRERFARFRAGWVAVCCCPEFHVQR